MTQHFDFDKIGKKTPYRIPEGFFDEMQHNVLKQTGNGPHRRIISIKHISYMAIGVAAAVSAFIFVPERHKEVETQTEPISWIEEASDEDLEIISSMAETEHTPESASGSEQESNIKEETTKNMAVTDQQSTSINWIEQISDEDLEAMDDMSECDIFMN